MIQIVNTNDTRLRLSQLNVGLFSTLSIALPQVPATATEVQVIITNGTIASAYNATLDTGDDCWKCDVNLGQFSSVGKQKYEVAYKIDGKQMWDGQGWIEILPATVSGITPQPTPPPTRYAAISVTVNGGDPVFADENGNIALTLPNYDGKLPFKPLPEYLHAIAMDDTYPADADAFYQSLVSAEIGGCSAVRIENKVGRNYDWKYDRAAEFVVKVSKVGSRHASVGIASLGSRLTENMVMSGEYQPLYRALAGMTLDGINDAGVVAEINVIPRDSTKDPVESSTRNIHALAVVRYALDNFATALEAAQYIAAHYYIPEGFTDSYHWSIYDINESYIVEDGEYHKVESGRPILTNHRVYSTDLYGSGYSRDAILSDASTITEALSSVKFTNAYAEGFPWADEFAGQIDGQGEIPYTATERLRAWATEHITPLLNEERKPAERGNGCWQTVHSTIYDFENKTMKVAVQESEDYYTFGMIGSGASITLDDTVTRTSENGVKSSGIWSAIWGALTALPSGFSSLYDWCVDKFAKKVDTQFTETIPAGAYTFTNGKNGFQAWAWKDENDEWHCVCVNKPDELIGPEIPGKYTYAVSFSTANYDEVIHLNNSGEWDVDADGLPFIDGYPIVNSITTSPINSTSFTDNLTTMAAKAKIAEAMPAPIDPANATASGKAADALAVKNALSGITSVDIVNFLKYSGSEFHFGSTTSIEPVDRYYDAGEMIKDADGIYYILSQSVNQGHPIPVSILQPYYATDGFLKLIELAKNNITKKLIPVHHVDYNAFLAKPWSAATLYKIGDCVKWICGADSLWGDEGDVVILEAAYVPPIGQDPDGTPSPWTEYDPTSEASIGYRYLSSLFSNDNGKLVETIEEHSGGGDTTFCLKYDPENDVFYYDDGEPETSNQGE